MIEIWKHNFLGLLLKAEEQYLNEALKIKLSKTPSKLFRYRGCLDYNLNSFSKDDIYLSNPSNFNDPFDCLAYFNFNEGIVAYNNDMINDNEDQFIENFKGIMYKILECVINGKSEINSVNQMIEEWVKSCKLDSKYAGKIINILKILFIEEGEYEKLMNSVMLNPEFDPSICNFDNLDTFVDFIGEQFRKELHNLNSETLIVQNTIANRIVNGLYLVE